MTSDHPIRWGIAATGRIAHTFAQDLRDVPGAVLQAVGSRTAAAAEAFAAEYAAPTAHGSYAALMADPDVDVVYVASPHTHHLEHGLLAIAAGKPVLVEKPLTVNARQAEQLVGAAREAGVFLMEAMWMACHPVIRAIGDGLTAGRYGTPRQVHADLGFVVERPPTDRLLDPGLGAGALLDMGIYPLTFAHLVLGPAEQLVATAGLAPQGFDLDIAISGRYPGGAVAALTSSMTSMSPRTATIATTTGRIDLPLDFHHPDHAVWVPRAGEPERIVGTSPLLGSGLGNEAAEVVRCLREGRTESPLVPHEQTLTLIRQMDGLRRQLGIRYAADDS